MPVYLGHPNNGQQTVSDALSARGIDLLRAKPSDVLLIAEIEVTQPAFSSYFSNLPAFIAAHNQKKVIPLRGAGFVITTPIDSCFPLRLPSVIMDFPKSLTQAQSEVLGRVGYDQVTIQNNKSALVFRSPTLDQIKSIRAFQPNPLTRTTQNTINLDCVGTVVLIRRIFSGFLLTHTYPAFSDESTPVPYEDFDCVLDTDRPLKRKRSMSDIGGKAINVQTGDSMEVEGSTSAAPVSLTDRIILHKAKPSRSDIPGWGSPSQIPNASGILFPYVPSLALNDKALVPSVIHDYFFKCLGSTFLECRTNFDKLKSAWGNIYTTDVGDMLSHLARMIQLSQSTQTRVFPIFDNETYAGSVLSGSRFALYSTSSVYKPITYASLQTEMASARFHSAVLTSISNMVADDDITAEIRQTTSMRQLSNILRIAEMSEESKDAVKKEAVHLNFQTTFLAANATTIGRAITLIKDTSEPIPDDYPLHPSCLFESERVASVLSGFGYQAPTFLIPSCPSLKLAGGVDPPKTFVFRLVSLSSAIADWKQMMKTKAITNNPANLSKAFKDRSLNSGEKKSTWIELVKLVNAEGTGVADTGNLAENPNTIDVGGGGDLFDF